ncbi:TonB-dependent hemoglobin/transferrin/lactoferrin family receptor [Roseomonas sp. NAR14]|uniref:TonB-dependent hemoglobin/transferrin/lactoferrin family receptor n=1 Tax=Roseomonas acroporae TaxID=2937791 RepID=A0A9X1Y8A8_9PROT|nr:TonB-dependent hemoglobin/transferrin/lactoferrin family receptor [Roseomonas acroporae]MCK8785754.1 TonB-dependent hemoglobin/transferrin/lactoferrin family receptor [Roseomonas acroporae]
MPYHDTRRALATPLAALLLATPLAAPPAARAQGAPPAGTAPSEAAGPATALDAVTTTATRIPQPIADVPATVTVIDAEQLERQNAVRPQDAVRYEPGVSFSNSPLRAGGGNFNIRGIGDNRVRVLIDGVRLPDFPESNIGAGTFTRDFVDLETVRRIEIVRGPASALYGSDAIGGVVNYITRDPGDYLDAATGRNLHASLRAGYSGADRSFTESVLGAARQGDVDAMLLYTRRDGHALDPNGRLSPNPQDYRTNSFLARTVWRMTPADTLRLTGELLTRQVSTDIRTDLVSSGSGAARTTVLSSRGDDETTRGRIQLDYSHTEPFLFVDRTDLHFYWSHLDRQELTSQLRYVGAGTPLIPNRLRWTDTSQDQDILGTDLQFRSHFSLFGVENRLVYGATVERIDTSRPRDRYEQNLVTGVFNATVAGETFPNKNFPDTTTYQTGVYLQDEFSVGRLSFLPAIRLDYYALNTRPDADFLRSAQTGTAAAVRNFDAFAASPKFGVTYRLDETYSLYGQYARGFRAPPYDTANFGFTNFQQFYTILPNGNLNPEYVNSFEGGLRGRFDDGSSFQLTGFYNRYSDFIETQTLGTTPAGLTVFQYGNVRNAEIYGGEARGEYRISPQWRLRAAAALAVGENLDTHRPLAGVDPLRGVLGVAWQSGFGLGAEANLTGALRNRRTATTTEFKAPAYAVLDLAMHYDLGSSFTINAGLFNVFNARYFATPDVVGLAATSANRDLYAQPGRYAAVNVTLRF